jgi:protein-S-isoprenylcysteine O-methyltransferase Ste14
VSGSDNPGVRVPPPLISLSLMLLGLAIDDRLSVSYLQWGWRQAAGLLLAAAAFGLIATALTQFGQHHTRPEPWRPASTLVTTGVYRFTRNPMYLGLAVLHFGTALYFGNLATALLLLPYIVLIDRFVMPREEAYLGRRFGAEYEAFRRRVRRWL